MKTMDTGLCIACIILTLTTKGFHKILFWEARDPSHLYEYNTNFIPKKVRVGIDPYEECSESSYNGGV